MSSLLGIAPVGAIVKLPPVFADHMVLQTGKPVPIWGKADPGEKVTVSFGGQKKSAEADKEGNWTVTLDAMPPNGEPQDLTVAGKNSRTITDVLVGEVWLCSGQSNMALPVSKALNFEAEKAAATWPKIRMGLPTNSKWVICSPETVGAFSAAAYFFGRELHQKTGVPIGLVHLSAGGTPIEFWTSQEAQQAVPELKPLFEAAAVASPAGAESAQAQSDAQQAVEVEGKQAVTGQKVGPGGLFTSRILPVVPFAIRGVIWYQGEANSYTVHANLYGIQLATMIKDWRNHWGYDFPFITVQLPNIGGPQTDPVQTCGRVLVREGELKSLSLPNTGLAVTIGTGEEKSNHPLNKQEAGRRLAQWALATVYDKKDVVASGPLPESSKIADGKVVVTFSHADGGLKAADGGELKGFAIAGPDMKWVWGKATIVGNTVIVSSPEVKDPVGVRYAWATNPSGSNLTNASGLPASPFRTDSEALSNTYMH